VNARLTRCSAIHEVNCLDAVSSNTGDGPRFQCCVRYSQARPGMSLRSIAAGCGILAPVFSRYSCSTDRRSRSCPTLRGMEVRMAIVSPLAEEVSVPSQLFLLAIEAASRSSSERRQTHRPSVPSLARWGKQWRTRRGPCHESMSIAMFESLHRKLPKLQARVRFPSPACVTPHPDRPRMRRFLLRSREWTVWSFPG